MLRNLKTCLVVPCYNEAGRLAGEEFVSFLEKSPNVSFLFVNDGSSDATLSILDELARRHPDNLQVVSLTENRGKAEAVRSGINHLVAQTQFDLVGYWDADLATPLDEIPRLVDVFLRVPPIQFVCGSRIRRMGASIERLPYRHYLGRVFATCVSIAVQLPIYDSQCGAKIMTKSLAENVFRKPFSSRWHFDVELLARIIQTAGKKRACEIIYELPLLRWHDKKGSKLSIRDFLMAPLDLLRIYWQYR